jgi:hypothetical protein
MEAGGVALYKIEINWARLGDFKNFSDHGFEQLLG